MNKSRNLGKPIIWEDLVDYNLDQRLFKLGNPKPEKSFIIGANDSAENSNTRERRLP
jgi:hypothetical protein